MAEVLRTCPAHNEAVANREYTPTLLAGSTAQEIYPDSDKLESCIQTLRYDVHSHYEQPGGMRNYNPGRADFLEERAVVDALTAPIFHAIEVDIIQNAVPALLGETALRPSNIVRVDFLDDTFCKPAADTLEFSRTASVWSAGAAEVFLRQVEADDSHWARPIYDMFYDIYPNYVSLERKHRFRHRSDDPRQEICNVEVDASNTAIKIIFKVAEKIQPSEAGPRNIKQYLLGKTEEMSWSSSVKVPEALVARWQPYAGNDKGHLWQNTPLTKGPWPVPGYCPAVKQFSAHTLPRRNTIDAVYKIKEDYSTPQRWLARPAGSASTAELRLIFATYIGSEIFKWE